MLMPLPQLLIACQRRHCFDTIFFFFFISVAFVSPDFRHALRLIHIRVDADYIMLFFAFDERAFTRC